MKEVLRVFLAVIQGCMGVVSVVAVLSKPSTFDASDLMAVGAAGGFCGAVCCLTACVLLFDE